METATITIYNRHDEEGQEVRIQYYIRRESREWTEWNDDDRAIWGSGYVYYIEQPRIIDPVAIEPYDLETAVMVGVADHENLPGHLVHLDGEIEWFPAVVNV